MRTRPRHCGSSRRRCGRDCHGPRPRCEARETTMPELYDLVEERIGDYTPSPDLRERVKEQAQRRRRTRRAGSALVAVVALAVVFGGLARVLAPSHVVLFGQP